MKDGARRRWLAWAGGVVGMIALTILGVVAVQRFIDADEDAPADQGLRRAAAGAARAEYLADGEPVWVVGHEDASVSIVSAFDTLEPFGIGKLTWWCPPAAGFDDPFHGSKWDAYGVSMGGPAPRGLTTWEPIVIGNRIWPGERREGAPIGTPHDGPDATERRWCAGPQGPPQHHTFAGWTVWTSPTEAVASAPEGWILLEGRAVLEADGSVRLCAAAGCDDAVMPEGVGPIPDRDLFANDREVTQYLARVRDGRLADLTRLAGPPAP